MGGPASSQGLLGGTAGRSWQQYGCLLLPFVFSVVAIKQHTEWRTSEVHVRLRFHPPLKVSLLLKELTGGDNVGALCG